MLSKRTVGRLDFIQDQWCKFQEPNSWGSAFPPFPCPTGIAIGDYYSQVSAVACSYRAIEPIWELLAATMGVKLSWWPSPHHFTNSRGVQSRTGFFRLNTSTGRCLRHPPPSFKCRLCFRSCFLWDDDDPRRGSTTTFLDSTHRAKQLTTRWFAFL